MSFSFPWRSSRQSPSYANDPPTNTRQELHQIEHAMQRLAGASTLAKTLASDDAVILDPGAAGTHVDLVRKCWHAKEVVSDEKTYTPSYVHESAPHERQKTEECQKSAKKSQKKIKYTEIHVRVRPSGAPLRMAGAGGLVPEGQSPQPRLLPELHAPSARPLCFLARG